MNTKKILLRQFAMSPNDIKNIITNDQIKNKSTEEKIFEKINSFLLKNFRKNDECLLLKEDFVLKIEEKLFVKILSEYMNTDWDIYENKTKKEFLLIPKLEKKKIIDGFWLANSKFIIYD